MSWSASWSLRPLSVVRLVLQGLTPAGSAGTFLVGAVDSLPAPVMACPMTKLEKANTTALRREHAAWHGPRALTTMHATKHRDGQQETDGTEQQLAAQAGEHRRAGERAHVVQLVRRGTEHRRAARGRCRAGALEAVAACRNFSQRRRGGGHRYLRPVWSSP